MANFGDLHQVTGAGWSVYWRINQLDDGDGKVPQGQLDVRAQDRTGPA